MAAQHKRPGRQAYLERKNRINDRQKPKHRVRVITFDKPLRPADGIGRVVAIGEYIA